MAVAEFNTFSGEEWYHGALSREEAEKNLRDSGSNCFLVRHSKGFIVLSQIQYQQIHHTRIECKPNWYKLGGISKCFCSLKDLIKHFSTNSMFSNSTGHAIFLEDACKKKTVNGAADETAKLARHITEENDPKVYTVGEPTHLTLCPWYHGKMNNERAEIVLEQGDHNKFLVRQYSDDLYLSSKRKGWIHHHLIIYNTDGYRLEERENVFKTIPEMISYYCTFPVNINSNQVLGVGCENKGVLEIPNHDDISKQKPAFKKGEYKFQVTWRKCADMPVARSTPQMVKIRDYVYAGGGLGKPGESKGIFRYNIYQDSWTFLPHCPSWHHSLASLDNRLVAIGGMIGGMNINAHQTNKLYTYKEMDGTWTEVLPPMPTPRSLLSVTTLEDRVIIAAGGVLHTKSNGEIIKSDVVELYINEDRQWYTTTRLPFLNFAPSIAVIKEVCYALGGVGAIPQQSRTTMSVNIPLLLENAKPASNSRFTPVIPLSLASWNILPGQQHPLLCSVIVEIAGVLIAIGGADESKIGTKFISMYNFHSNSWMECKGAELPIALFRSGVLKLNHENIMIGGGECRKQEFSAQVFIGQFN